MILEYEDDILNFFFKNFFGETDRETVRMSEKITELLRKRESEIEELKARTQEELKGCREEESKTKESDMGKDERGGETNS